MSACKSTTSVAMLRVANLLNHHKDFKLAASHKKEDWAGKDVETQIAFIKHMIDWLPTIADDASADDALQSAYPSGKVASEMVPTLKGFLSYLEKLNDRLGRTHIDATVTNASKYLAVEDDLHDTDPNYDKFFEIGHLLLIEKVTVFKNTALFQDAKIRIVDTPGTDSANPRQRDITHEYLKEADVVFSLLDPKGFTMANMDIIAEMAKANMGNIKDKMFFAINKLIRCPTRFSTVIKSANTCKKNSIKKSRKKASAQNTSIQWSRSLNSTSSLAIPPRSTNSNQAAPTF